MHSRRPQLTTLGRSITILKRLRSKFVIKFSGCAALIKTKSGIGCPFPLEKFMVASVMIEVI
jgi:hypothetical protein